MRPFQSPLRRIFTLNPLSAVVHNQIRLQSLLSRPTFARANLPAFRWPLSFQRRHLSSIGSPGQELENTQAQSRSTDGRDEPAYELTFTCRPCMGRSTHRVSKQGYHHGTVLITCPSCHNRHIISDHLRIFGEVAVGLEDILKEREKDLSKLLKKGKLGIRQGSMVGNEGEETIEFWEDGTETAHKAQETEGQ